MGQVFPSSWPVFPSSHEHGLAGEQGQVEVALRVARDHVVAQVDHVHKMPHELCTVAVVSLRRLVVLPSAIRPTVLGVPTRDIDAEEPTDRNPRIGVDVRGAADVGEEDVRVTGVAVL
jgi:hypothetical protein